MKKILLSLSLFALLAACNNASENKTANTGDSAGMAMNAGPSDTAQARKDLDKLMDSLDNAFKRKDIGYIDQYMAKDGMYAGTDPGEIWSFDEMRSYTERAFREDSTMKTIDFNVDRRIIHVNGASANIMEQYVFPAISKKVMVRNVGHARYENGRWLLDMYTYNIIPKNADLLKMDKVL